MNVWKGIKHEVNKKGFTNLWKLRIRIIINFHAVGMALAQPLGFEIDFVINPIS